jgi:AraC family transcriptional regulator
MDAAASSPPPALHFSQLSVGRALLRSRATVQRAQALPGGVWLAHWHNADTEAAYVQPEHHTVSFYMAGGRAVRCIEAPGARGEPGAMCCLPAGHDSRWVIADELQLMHLYLPRLQLAQAAERWFDLDPRSAALADRIYFRDPMLEAMFARIAAADWQATDAALQLQHLALDMQARLLAAHTVHRRALPAMRGGLAPAARRRVLARIEAGLRGGTAALSLGELADEAHLSDHHFAHMFKASFGCSPHAWVMQRRLAHARELLAQGRLALTEIAARCGYAHLSHLNAALRRAGLASAARYRRLG